MAPFGFLERIARQAGSTGLTGRLAAWIVLGGLPAARRAHREAWAPELEHDGDGLTVFQRRTDLAVRALLNERGVSHERTDADDTDGRSIRLTAPGPITITVLPDEAQVRSASEAMDIQRWDTRTPHELRDCVIEMLRRHLPAPPGR